MKMKSGHTFRRANRPPRQERRGPRNSHESGTFRLHYLQICAGSCKEPRRCKSKSFEDVINVLKATLTLQYNWHRMRKIKILHITIKKHYVNFNRFFPHLSLDARHDSSDVGGRAMLKNVLHDIVAILILHQLVHILAVSDACFGVKGTNLMVHPRHAKRYWQAKIRAGK